MDKARRSTKPKKGINRGPSLRDIKMISSGGYSVEDVSSKFDDLKRMPGSSVEILDTDAWERFIHNLPQEQLEVFVCLYLGFAPEEIVEVLELKTIGHYYNINARLRSSYREQRWQIFEYNK